MNVFLPYARMKTAKVNFKMVSRNSLAVQWLRLSAFTVVGPGSIPGRGTKIPQD